MNSNLPINRSISWPAYFIIFALSAGFIFSFDYIFQTNDIFYPIMVISALAIILRVTIPRSHRKGIQAIKENDYSTATTYFKESVDYFTRNEWVDRYRVITILSASKMCYREMGLCNIAFCYSQTGKAEKAKALYKEILQEYPENGIAYYALNSINTFSNQAD
ncbi:tetratricopeptide repeat protein [Sphingobacterium multivorum]|uniref:tetratricopeptide repeat protein n=1 Tax=Sphingobacterium multivorum TaxID=28454 RepID=UPI0028A6FF01|nr:tetratricopeptide repeat protein [Sphingobacterium multivorum]